MAAPRQGALKKLQITACSIDKSTGNISLESGKSNWFTVMMNPNGYSHTYSITYSKKKPQGAAGNDTKFAAVNPDKINFQVWIDGTGVVRDYSQKSAAKTKRSQDDVKTQLKNLNGVIYQYKGVDHEPRVVRLLWGSMIFYGRLASMKVDYKLFKPNGEPLRALVTLDFTGFVSKGEEAKKAKRSSPDLTHVVVVKAGDTLPLLCNRIYSDCSYYLEVARANGISHFRDIKPGQKLYFPPLS
jgi:nucleoid-associated protein YgaU